MTRSTIIQGKVFLCLNRLYYAYEKIISIHQYNDNGTISGILNKTSWYKDVKNGFVNHFKNEYKNVVNTFKYAKNNPWEFAKNLEINTIKQAITFPYSMTMPSFNTFGQDCTTLISATKKDRLNLLGDKLAEGTEFAAITLATDGIGKAVEAGASYLEGLDLPDGFNSFKLSKKPGFIRLGGWSDEGAGKGKNNLKPDPAAERYPHSTFKTDPETGKVTNYETYKSNPRNPSTGVERVKRYDGQGKGHVNKNGEKVETPHVHDESLDDVRKPYPDEIPK